TAPGTVMVSSTAGTAARMSPRTIARACSPVGARTTAMTPAGTAGRGSLPVRLPIRVTARGLQPGQRGVAGAAVPGGQPPAPGPFGLGGRRRPGRVAQHGAGLRGAG